MSSSAKEKLKKEKGGSGKKGTWSRWLKTRSSFYFSLGQMCSGTIYYYSRHIGWFVVTTGIITLLPLILEVIQSQDLASFLTCLTKSLISFQVNREVQIEEFERSQINGALADGRTPQELANEGLTAAVQPSVLK